MLTNECRVLNLGCGQRRLANAINVDVSSRASPDVVHDLNDRPWPFPDSSFSYVYATDVIEHLRDTVGTMEELYRICEPAGVIDLVVPHFSASSAFRDPTHCHFFSRFTFDYFVEGHPLAYYSTARFRLRTARIVFHPTLLNKLVWRLANRFPTAYEERWAWIFPAWFLHVQLEAVKAGDAVLHSTVNG